MGNVIELRKPATKTKARGVLETLQNKESEGNLHGCINIAFTDEGAQFAVEGVYADRLQFTAYALLKAMVDVTDKIIASGTAGRSSVESIYSTLPSMPQRLPPGLQRRT